MISADTQRLDRFSAFGHLAWVAPIQLLVAIGLLIGNVGLFSSQTIYQPLHVTFSSVTLPSLGSEFLSSVSLCNSSSSRR